MARYTIHLYQMRSLKHGSHLSIPNFSRDKTEAIISSIAETYLLCKFMHDDALIPITMICSVSSGQTVHFNEESLARGPQIKFVCVSSYLFENNALLTTQWLLKYTANSLPPSLFCSLAFRHACMMRSSFI